MKRIIVIALSLVLLLCACSEQEDVTDVIETVPSTEQSAPLESLEAAGSEKELTIVSDYHPEYGDFERTNSAAKDYQRIYRYAEYVDTGIRMMAAPTDFVTGKLIYDVSNVRIAESTADMNLPTDCFSVPLCEVLENGEISQPAWIGANGQFSDHSMILVDVTVTNDGAENKAGKDKYGYSIDPYVFSAGGFVFLYNDSITPGGGYANYDAIKYCYVPQEHIGHNSDKFAFRLMPNESVTLTVGFILGKPDGQFESTDHLFLSNSCGNKDSIIIDMNLSE